MAAAPADGGAAHFQLRGLPGFSETPIEFTRAFWNTRRTFRALWSFVVVAVLIALTVLIVLTSEGRIPFKYEPQRVAFVFSTIFTCLTVPISIYGIHMHLAHHSKPHIQRHIIRVLWMVPIYGLNAWLALVLGLFCADERVTVVPDAFRSCYEAYTIYSFYNFIVAYIEDKEGLPLADVMAAQPEMTHIFPLRLALWTPSRGWFQVYSAPPWRMGREFLRHVEFGIHNYVIVKPMVTLATLICAASGVYGANQFRGDKAYPYLVAVDSSSQAWALYCLLQVYLNTHAVLASTGPGLKFLCVKGVVFATFWQGAVLSLLSYTHAIAGLNMAWSTSCTVRDEMVVDALQDFLIACEMLIFAVLHAYAFPSREYRDAHLPKRAAAARLKHLFDVRDVAEDVARHARGAAAGAVAAAGAALAAGASGIGGTLRRAWLGGEAAGGEDGSGGGGGGSGGSGGAGGGGLRRPLLDDFDDADLQEAPWLRLPPPAPHGTIDSRPSSEAGD